MKIAETPDHTYTRAELELLLVRLEDDKVGRARSHMPIQRLVELVKLAIKGVGK